MATKAATRGQAKHGRRAAGASVVAALALLAPGSGCFGATEISVAITTTVD